MKSTDLNRTLNHYLNGITDSPRHILTGFLGRKASPPAVSLGGVLCNKYEDSVARKKSAEPLASKEVTGVRTFKDWLCEARDMPHQDFLRPVYELHDFVDKHFTRNEILGFYIHGSISTLDYAPYYSDLDTVVIVRNPVLHDPRWFADFRERFLRSTTYLYLVDPFQHHGHFVLTEYDMMAYRELLFPTILFKFATELSEFGVPLHFQIVKETNGVKEAIQKRFHYYYEYWPTLLQKGRMAPYDLKNLIQDVLFLILLYAEARDAKYYYKREVFNRQLLQEDLSEEALAFLAAASRIRQDFRLISRFPYRFKKLLGLYGHPRGLHLLLKRFDHGPWKGILGQSGAFILQAQAVLQSVANKLDVI